MNDDDLTTDLGRELRDRSDAMHGSSLALADVQQRARSIRRRRTVTAVGGAVAAIALIVPTAALANHHGGHTTEPLPATQSVTPTPSPTTSDGHQPPAGVLDVSDLPTGAPPQIAYVTDDEVRLPGGTTAPTQTRYPVIAMVNLQGTRIFETAGQGRFWVEVIGFDGTQLGQWRIQGGLAVNASHTIAAWVDPVGQVMTWSVGAVKPRPLGDPVPGEGLVVGAVSGDDCSLACSVIVNAGAGDRQPWEVSEASTRPLLDGGYLSIDDISQAGLSIGYTKITDSGSCSALAGGGEFQGFSTCENTLSTFSPDGQLMMGLPAYPDGLGPNQLAMYDLTGKRLFDRRATEQAQATFQSQAWEDDTHVLISVFQAGKWSIVRIGTDGSMEYAVPPVAGEDVDNPYVLSS